MRQIQLIRWRIIAGVVTVVVFFGATAHAIEESLTYQGVVVNPDGTQVTKEQAPCIRDGAQDTCDFRARLYTNATGGDLVWEYVVKNVEIADHGGRFVLTLDCGGDFAACNSGDGPDFSHDKLFVEVAFDPSGNADFAEGETFTPRSALTAVAYAFAAQDAQTLTGIAPSAFLRTDRDSTVADDAMLKVNGALNINGDISIADTQIALDGTVTDLAVKGDFSINNDDFFVQKTTGALGIGTRAPRGALHTTTAQDLPALYVDATHGGATMAPAMVLHTDSALDTALALRVGAEATDRLRIGADGAIAFGDGDAAADTTLYRSAPQTLKTDQRFIVGTSLSVGTDDATYPITTASGAHLTVGGTWTNTSDARLKENFTPLDGADVLERLARLRITQWNYKVEDDAITHIGPTAQDFYAAFGLGGSDTSISTIDPSGVAIVGVQELYARTQAQDARLTAVEEQLGTVADDTAVATQKRIAAELARKDAKIAALEEDVAQLKEYYEALADAYIALAPEQFDKIASRESTSESDVVNASEERSDPSPTVEDRETEGATNEKTAAAEEVSHTETQHADTVDSHDANHDAKVTDSASGEMRTVTVPADDRSERTVFVAFADLRADDIVTVVYDDAQEKGNSEGGSDSAQQPSVVVDDVIAGTGFRMRIVGTLRAPLHVVWRVESDADNENKSDTTDA